MQTENDKQLNLDALNVDATDKIKRSYQPPKVFKLSTQDDTNRTNGNRSDLLAGSKGGGQRGS